MVFFYWVAVGYYGTLLYSRYYHKKWRFFFCLAASLLKITYMMESWNVLEFERKSWKQPRMFLSFNSCTNFKDILNCEIIYITAKVHDKLCWRSESDSKINNWSKCFFYHICFQRRYSLVKTYYRVGHNIRIKRASLNTLKNLDELRIIWTCLNFFEKNSFFKLSRF